MSAWVLLRGLTREAGHWGGFAQQFQQVEPGVPVLALDLAGAGLFHRERAPRSVAALVTHARAQLAQHGLQPPLRLVGLSLGGMVAAEWALQAPSEVSHCVLINTSMRPLAPLHERLHPACWPTLLRLLFSGDAQGVEQAVLQLTSSSPTCHADVVAAWTRIRELRPVSRANAVRQLLAAARFRLGPQTPRARALVLGSRGDRLVSVRCSQRLAEHWGCSLVVHPHAGHDLPLDAPQWVLHQVQRWLRT